MANNSDAEFSYYLSDWFWERNIKLPPADPALSDTDHPTNGSQDGKGGSTPSDAPKDDIASGYLTDTATGFSAPKESLAELLDMARGLMVFDENTDLLVPESNFLIRSTTAGVAWRHYLDWIVQDLAQKMGAAVVTVSLQDLENLGTDFFAQEIEWRKTHGERSRPWGNRYPDRQLRYPMSNLFFSDVGSGDRQKMAMSAILDAVQDKQSELFQRVDKEPDDAESPEITSEGEPICDSAILIQIRDAEEFGDMDSNMAGRCICHLHRWVRDRREEGQEIALVCCTSGQSRWYENMFRKQLCGTPSLSITIEPPEPITDNAELERARVRQNNIWKIKRLLRERCAKLIQPGLLDPFTEWTGLSEEEYEAMGRRDWSHDAMRRAKIQIPGRSTGGKPADLDDIWTVFRRLGFLKTSTDETNSESESNVEVEEAERKEQTWNSRVREMAGRCNDFETQLLDCVVNPSELKITWDDVILDDDDTKDTMMQLVTMSRFRPKATSSFMLKHIRINGALLYGPPGTGKTHLCRAIAAASGSNMLSVDSAALQSKWVGESEKYVRAAFTLAEKLHPCVLFMDEVDAMFYRRSSSDKDWTRRSLTQFLTGMDGLSKSGKAPFVLVATNRPWDLDEAFLRRLPQKIFFYLPNEECRRRILGTFVTPDDLEDDVDLGEVAKETKGYSGSDLRAVCAQAGLSWTIEQVRREGAYKVLETSKLKLNNANFKRAIRMIRPSNATSVPREMVDFVKRFNPDVLEEAPTKD
ncbi:putative atpase family aaa domain-containing protein 1 protein [Colletotrichum karsti]|uniref:Atpase family aaa domain-containing protein 1 protein n=1 Tax=Colletotrichum karsti TaxID=1095194 RepID=A0A9P6I7M5_9PEZI|nr:putative atpase family aaa domain-containing protein 1 protein [Colletotrichum karsti]KAF9877863.1 putative atpase family aaa domain-containing protein 1 protein [Colletotrichum karsti]